MVQDRKREACQEDALIYPRALVCSASGFLYRPAVNDPDTTDDPKKRRLMPWDAEDLQNELQAIRKAEAPTPTQQSLPQEGGARVAKGRICEAPIHDATEKKPREYHTVRLFLAEDETAAGLWTGKVWWAHGKEAFPSKWQEFDTTSVGFREENADAEG